jgi:hypothetical protein
VKNGRQTVIDEVTQAVMSDRNQDYAPPEDNFARIAALWSTYLDTEVTPYDTAVMMVLLKVARAMHSPHILDHLVDGAGYFACAADVMPAAEPEPEPEPELADEGTPLRYNGEDGRLFAPTDPGSEFCVWLSSVSGKKARMSGRDWELAVDAGAASFIGKDI